MNAILGFSHLLRMYKDEPERILDYTEKIEKSGEFLLSLINNVLELARIESGRHVHSPASDCARANTLRNISGVSRRVCVL